MCDHDYDQRCFACLRRELRITTDSYENGRRLMHHLQLNGMLKKMKDEIRAKADNVQKPAKKESIVQPSLEMYEVKDDIR